MLDLHMFCHIFRNEKVTANAFKLIKIVFMERQNCLDIIPVYSFDVLCTHSVRAGHIASLSRIFDVIFDPYVDKMACADNS